LITVLGASGFIGSHLIRKLESEGIDYSAPARDEDITTRNAGHVIYCIGLTSDFRTKPFETVDAHVCLLLKILRQCEFESFLYLSSTRVYGAKKGIAQEDDIIQIQPLDFDEIYNISKVMGESICFAAGKRNVRVARLSNVYGYDSKSTNFAFSLIRDSLRDRKIVLHTSLDSAKDYINIKDAVDILLQIALSGRREIYNVASGINITNLQIVDLLHDFTGYPVEVDRNARSISFPQICIKRIIEEFAFKPAIFTSDLAGLVSMFRNSSRK
jgi:nucleoside-diphosphate-sugar epimerase